MDSIQRKYIDYLTISARALIGFGIWGILRTFYINARDKSVIEMLAEQVESVSGIDATISIVFCMIVWILADIAFRVYIYRSVKREIKGRNNGILPLCVAALYIVLSVIAAVIYIKAGTITGSLADNISVVLIDMTSLVCLVIIIVYSIKYKRLLAIECNAGGQIAG